MSRLARSRWHPRLFILQYIHSLLVSLSDKTFLSLVRMIDESEILMIAFTLIPNIQLQLPAGNDNTSSLNLVVRIRDTLNCITEYNLTSVTVLPDTVQINDFIRSLQASNNAANGNSIVRALTSGNQNVVGQLIISLSQIFNQMNTQSLQNTISSNFLSPSHRCFEISF